MRKWRERIPSGQICILAAYWPTAMAADHADVPLWVDPEDDPADPAPCQPMATAPRDGRPVWIAVEQEAQTWRDLPHIMMICGCHRARWTGGGWRRVVETKELRLYGDKRCSANHDEPLLVTHWQPCPRINAPLPPLPRHPKADHEHYMHIVGDDRYRDLGVGGEVVKA